ncbi:P-loop containing nucleoside triphosphate hydrolase protein [Auricularia subglabra TFB-10046 SS5]|nr:P-loop containing nucleoside triphosphate hydrolase protein [Auricularia subglabra TFB-10046 SS5]
MAHYYAVDVQHLTFAHKDETIALHDLSLQLNHGARVLLIGANGAGKSTLLQLLAGKRMIRQGLARILGKEVFMQTPKGVTFLGTEWAMNPVVRSDIVVSHFLDSVGGYRHKDRRDRLLDILDIDLDWHMHQISDGERRRVQLCMGLMVPWDVLLLDEVTVDLDVLVRDDLLAFLKQESEERGATIVYATHIFDGLDGFPTHIAHMRDGRFVAEPQAVPAQAQPGHSLHRIALQWLKDDRDVRRAQEASGEKKKTRGSRATNVPTDSETFYKKYDYSH